MKKTFEEKLITTFPRLFKVDPTMISNLMIFGCECDKGWNKLIWRLCEKINKLKLPKFFKVVQIKEKYGGLSFLVSCGADDIYDLIEEYEDKSYKKCELCGMPGALSHKGFWYKTLCIRHRLTNGYKKCKKNEDV